jgi:hypothetical protein
MSIINIYGTLVVELLKVSAIKFFQHTCLIS